ncbi:MAG: cell division ATP-binding protein FtsE [Clostridia bacterium]|nr:cell division ATP-binding protein FtsE [Clostridia bacterium]
MIEFRNVTKTFEDTDTHAINGISMKIQDGELVFIVGVSGAGKSTLLKLITREQLPTSGDILIDGTYINHMSRRKVPFLRRKLGMVYQDFRLITKMTVFENIAFALRVTGKKETEIQEKVPYVLDLVGLTDKKDCHPNQLSGGEQQRVSLARALANNPKILIADEPTANIDNALSLEMMTLLKTINESGTTVLIVTHDKTLVEAIGGRVIELDKGVIISDSKPEETSDDETLQDSSIYDKLVEQAQSETDNMTTDTVSNYEEIVEQAKKELQ